MNETNADTDERDELLARLGRIVSGQATVISKLNHENDELRHRVEAMMDIITYRDSARDTGTGWAVGTRWMSEIDRAEAQEAGAQ